MSILISREGKPSIIRKNKEFSRLLRVSELKVANHLLHGHHNKKDSFYLGVCRIVIFAESEYSAEYTLPNPNILPNIRHCRIMKKISLIKLVFNADVQSSK